MTLDELATQIKSCTKCPLRATATQPIPGLGIVGAKYMILGDRPGVKEDRLGAPFVGEEGKKLDKLLALAGIDQNDCYFTNVIRCRPPETRLPRKAELRACLPYLIEEIKLVSPEYIITLGVLPLSLFSKNPVRSMHGTSFEVEVEDG